MINPISDRELLAYAAQALDPGTRHGIEAALDADPPLRRRLAVLQLGVDALLGIQRWTLPAPQAHRPAPLPALVRPS